MKFSIITVTYNCVNTIEKTIQSVINQNYKDIEYIIIDGGSTDGTTEIIEKYSDRISYWISEKDNGIYDAMNKGILASSGEWISFINGDDWYLPNVFEKVLEITKDKDIPILYGYVNAFIDGNANGYVGISEPVETENIHFGNLYCHQGLFIKRELFDIIGFYDLKYKTFSDYDWILKAHNMGYNPYIMNIKVACFSLGGLSSVNKDSDEEQQIIIKNYKNHKKFICELEKKRGRAEFVLLMRHNTSVFKELIGNNKVIYQWGTGYNGKECYEILKINHYEIESVIESSPKTDIWNDIVTISSKEFFKKSKSKEDYLIIIASEKYEDNIEKCLLENNISKDHFIKMTDFYRWSYNNFNSYII